MKVLLISANTTVEPYPVYPLGLDYVAGAIADNHQVTVLDLNQHGCDTNLQTAIRRFGPDVIGISLRNVDNTDAADPMDFIDHYRCVMAAVRQAANVPVILGGSAFTIFPREFMQKLEADYGVAGEGERLTQLLNSIEKGNDANGLPGIFVGPTSQHVSADQATGNGQTGHGLSNSGQRLCPSTIHRRFDKTADHLPFYLKNGGMLNLQTKRGCPFRCVYCSYPHIEGRKMRLFQPEQIARTAMELQEAGAKYLFIADSAYNADAEHSLQVARAFKAAGVTVPWGGFFAPVRMPQDYFRVLADCGLKHVEFGTEALADPVLESYGKPFTVAQVFKAHQAANAAGLHVAHYFLLGGPGESGQTLKTTFSNIDKLEKTVLFLFCGMRVYPNTALYDISLEQGQIEASRDILAPVFYEPPSLPLEEIFERIEVQAKERVNWVTSSNGHESVRIMNRMYEKGYSGPLWEYLIR